MHYEHFKQTDPRVLKGFIGAFPFATIAVNGPDGPIIAQDPLVYHQGSSPNGIVEFHLANANPIMKLMKNEEKITIQINGPSAPISPSWYKGRFPDSVSDRSNTAPTYDYINAALKGAIQVRNTRNLEKHLGELTSFMEPKNGWKFSEINPGSFDKWKMMITCFRMPIESFDLTAKISQEQKEGDVKGVIEGLKERGDIHDMALAKIIELFDGTADSLIKGLKELNPSKGFVNQK